MHRFKGMTKSELTLSVRVCDLLGGKTLYSYPDLLGDTLTNDTE
jgi:hypothetical protein